MPWLWLQWWSNNPCSGPSEREDAGAGREKQPEQWVAVHQEETGGDWKSEGKCLLTGITEQL